MIEKLQAAWKWWLWFLGLPEKYPLWSVVILALLALFIIAVAR